MNKFRSWNEKEQCFIYFQNGFYGINGAVFENNRMGFNWQNAEQSTGLFDNSGKEIFVGDIAKMHYFRLEGTCNGVVEEDREMIGIIGIDVFGKYLLVDNNRHYFVIYLEEPSEELEVIGNIHEGEN